jgi:hypothetical protein
MSWNNEDGLFQRFDLETAQVAGDGESSAKVQTLKVVIDSQDVPVLADIHGDRPSLPAHAVIVDAFLVATTAFTGTGTLDVGLGDIAQSAIDANGIDAAVDVDVALAAIGDVVSCDGALADKTATIGASAGYVTAGVTGSITAGVAELYIRYFKPDMDG